MPRNIPRPSFEKEWHFGDMLFFLGISKEAAARNDFKNCQRGRAGSGTQGTLRVFVSCKGSIIL